MLKKILSVATLAATVLFAAHGLAADHHDAYVGNSRSKKFHYRYCSTIKNPDAPHFIHFKNRDAAIEAGYAPCQRCKP